MPMLPLPLISCRVPVCARQSCAGYNSRTTPVIVNHREFDRIK